MFRSRVIGGFVGALLLVAPGMALAGQHNGPPEGGRGDGYGEVQARFKEVRGRMLRQEAGLSEATAQKTEKVLDQFDPRRREIMRDMHQRMQTLRELLQNDSADQKAYQEVLDAIQSDQKDMEQLKSRQIEALKQVLTPKEQARVLMTMKQMHHRTRQMLRQYRGERRGPDGNGPPDEDSGEHGDGLF